MRHPNRLAAAVMVVSALSATACGKDPEVAKREFMQSGDAFFAEKKYAEAAIQYRNAIQQDPQFGEARKNLARTYLNVGDGPNAYREAIRAADLLPGDAEAQLNAGQLLLAARQFEDAQSRAEKALALSPRNVEAQILRANALAGLNKMSDAIAGVEEAIRTDPERMGSYASLGVLRLVSGEREEAETAFRKAVDVNPKSLEARLALANYYWAVGRGKDAETHLKAAHTLDPKDSVANRALAMFYVGSRRAREAEPYLKAVADLEPDSAGKLTLADYYVSSGRPQEARRVLEEVAAGTSAVALGAKLRLANMGIARDAATAARLVDEVLAKEPSNTDGLILKAQILANERKFEEALRSLQTAAQSAPYSAAVQFATGRVQTARRDNAAAIVTFTEALRLNPRMATAEVELAKLHLIERRLDRAEEHARAATLKMPGYAEAYVVLARTYLIRGQTAKAEPIVRGLVKALPATPDIQAELGQLELLKGNRVAARAAFHRALEKNPLQLDAVTGLVTMDIQDGRTEAAKGRIDLAVSAEPQNGFIAGLAARTYARAGDLVGAERLAKRSIELDPINLDAYSLLGGLYVSQHGLNEAITQFTKGLEQNPRSVGMLTAIGILLEMQNKDAEARAKYEQALALDPRAAVAANNLAMIHTESGGNLDVALELAKSAKAELPNQHEFNDTLGWVYYKKGLHSMAVAPLLESIKSAPKNAGYHYHLALVYQALGAKDKARIYFEKSLALDASFDGADEARRLLAQLRG